MLLFLLSCVPAWGSSNTSPKKTLAIYAEVGIKKGWNDSFQLLDDTTLQKIILLNDHKSPSLIDANKAIVSKKTTKETFQLQEYLEAAEYLELVRKSFNDYGYSISFTDKSETADIHIRIKRFGFYQPAIPTVMPSNYGTLFESDSFIQDNRLNNKDFDRLYHYHSPHC
jgi:hypothetical protein